MQEDQYIPGVCNIGPEEINRRRKQMYIAIIFLVGNIFLLQYLHANHWWRLTTFLFATSFASGFQQTYFKFCLGFGMKGIFNFGEAGKTYSVEQKEYFDKDRARALKMLGYSILFGAVFSTVYYFLS